MRPRKGPKFAEVTDRVGGRQASIPPASGLRHGCLGSKVSGWRSRSQRTDPHPQGLERVTFPAAILQCLSAGKGTTCAPTQLHQPKHQNSRRGGLQGTSYPATESLRRKGGRKGERLLQDLAAIPAWPGGPRPPARSLKRKAGTDTIAEGRLC